MTSQSEVIKSKKEDQNYTFLKFSFLENVPDPKFSIVAKVNFEILNGGGVMTILRKIGAKFTPFWGLFYTFQGQNIG